MSTNDQQSTKTPGQMLKIGALVFIVPIIVIIFLVKMNMNEFGGSSGPMDEEAIAQRIAPVAHYNTGQALVEEESDEPLTGEQVYSKLCLTCHDAGVSDAPIFGDEAQWADRIEAGEDTLFKHAIEGLNAMPAKGGDPSLSDLEVKRAVVYMVNESGGDLDEPEEE